MFVFTQSRNSAKFSVHVIGCRGIGRKQASAPVSKDELQETIDDAQQRGYEVVECKCCK